MFYMFRSWEEPQTAGQHRVNGGLPVFPSGFLTSRSNWGALVWRWLNRLTAGSVLVLERETTLRGNPYQIARTPFGQAHIEVMSLDVSTVGLVSEINPAVRPQCNLVMMD